MYIWDSLENHWAKTLDIEEVYKIDIVGYFTIYKPIGGQLVTDEIDALFVKDLAPYRNKIVIEANKYFR